MQRHHYWLIFDNIVQRNMYYTILCDVIDNIQVCLPRNLLWNLHLNTKVDSISGEYVYEIYCVAYEYEDIFEYFKKVMYNES